MGGEGGLEVKKRNWQPFMGGGIDPDLPNGNVERKKAVC